MSIHFIDDVLPKQVSEIGGIEIEASKQLVRIKFGRIEIGKPVIEEADGSIYETSPVEAICDA